MVRPGKDQDQYRNNTDGQCSKVTCRGKGGRGCDVITLLLLKLFCFFNPDVIMR